MGNANVKWQGQESRDYLQFLNSLFGAPYIFSGKPEGVAIWTEKSFLNKTLFGNPVCFRKIVLKDESVEDKKGQKSFLYLIVKAPIDSKKICNLNKIVPSSGYDITKKHLGVRCKDIDTGIANLRSLTNYALGSENADQYVSSHDVAVQSIDKTSSVSEKIEITKSLYKDLCANLGKLMAKNSSLENMMDEPYYATSDPYYATNQPGNIALGEGEEELYYRREKPLIFPDIAKRSLSRPMAPEDQMAIPPPDPPQLLASFATVVRKENLVSQPSPSCKGACLDRFYSVMGSSNRSNALFQAGSATPRIIFKKEYFNISSPLSVSQAYKYFQPKSGVEHFALLNPDSHVRRLENLTDMQINKLFQLGSIYPTIVLLSPENGKKEHIVASNQLTLGQAYKLLQPRNPLTRSAAMKLEGMSNTISLGQAYKLFEPKKDVRIEEMSTGVSIDAQVRSCDLFLKEIRNKKEHMTSKDPRFIPYNALVKFQIGSDIVDIDRVYGTVAQKANYPKYTDMLKYGCTSVDCKKTENFGSFVGDQFYES